MSLSSFLQCYRVLTTALPVTDSAKADNHFPFLHVNYKHSTYCVLGPFLSLLQVLTSLALTSTLRGDQFYFINEESWEHIGNVTCPSLRANKCQRLESNPPGSSLKSVLLITILSCFIYIILQPIIQESGGRIGMNFAETKYYIKC